MARRAALIASKKNNPADDTVRIYLAGPYELADIDENKSPAKGSPRAIGQAYATMGYDAMMITDADAAVLGPNPPKELKGWLVPNGVMVSRIIERGGMRIGLVFFPTPEVVGRPIPEAYMDAVEKEIARLRPWTDALIGVSPWGMEEEQTFLQKGEGTGGTVDILLGGGRGPGNHGKTAAGGATAWLRPFSKGKAVAMVRLESMTRKSKGSGEDPSSGTRFEQIILDDAAPTDAAMDALLAPARTRN